MPVERLPYLFIYFKPNQNNKASMKSPKKSFNNKFIFD